MRIALTFIATLALALPSHAAVGTLFRAYLSVNGNDANPCTLAQPCRLLPAALTAVAEGGEVWMLDSANYNSGPVQVTKHVTILAVPGAVGSVVSTGGGLAALRVIAGGLKVTLRNLVVTGLVGATGATSGVEVDGSSHVLVMDCDIANLTDGVTVTEFGRATLLRGVLRGMSGNGVFAGSSANVAIDGTKFVANTVGISAQSLVNQAVTQVTVKEATLSNNSIGVQAAGAGGGQAWVHLDQSHVVASTSRALNLIATSPSGALVYLNGSRLVNADNSVVTGSGSEIWSYGNNAIIGPSTSGTLLSNTLR